MEYGKMCEIDNILQKVSIVVPIYNERENVELCLKALKSQSYPNIEIIIVDNGGNNKTMDLVKDYADKIVVEKRYGISYAKNSGIKIAEGEFIVTTDADCIPYSDWIEELVKCFTDQTIASVGGPNLISQGATKLENAISVFLGSFARVFRSRYVFDAKTIVETFHNPGCNAMYRREILEEIGGFDESLCTVEDEELDSRIKERGYRILFTPYAKVRHNKQYNLKKFIRQVYKYAIGRAQFIKLHPDINQTPRIMPSLAVLFIAILLITGLIINPFFLKLVLIESLIFVVAMLTAAFSMSLKTGKYYIFRYMSLILVTFVVWALGFITGLWSRKSSRERNAN